MARGRVATCPYDLTHKTKGRDREPWPVMPGEKQIPPSARNDRIGIRRTGRLRRARTESTERSAEDAERGGHVQRAPTIFGAGIPRRKARRLTSGPAKIHVTDGFHDLVIEA
jgi:hypothetical protein